MNKIVDALQLVRGRATNAAEHPVVAGPLAKVVAFKDWWPACLAVLLALVSNSNLAAALLAAQAWSVGKERAFESFLKVLFYLSVSVVLGPGIALVLLLVDSHKNDGDDSTAPSSPLADQVVFYRKLACDKVKSLLDGLALQENGNAKTD